MALEDITIRIGAETKGVDTVFGRIESRLNKTASKLQSIGTRMSLAITAPLAIIGKSAIDLSVDVEESENLFEVSLGKMSKQARAFSKELQQQLGGNAFTIRKNVGVIDAMAKGMGYADETAFTLAKSMEILKQDMASFFNLRPEEAFMKLQAGIVGEVEPLRRLGVLVDEQTVRQTLMSKGLITTGEELSQQQKVMGRYLAILEQTKLAQGDMARTIFSTANVQRLLGERWIEARKLLGDDLKPLYATVVNILRVLLQRFIDLDPALRKNAIKVAGLGAAMGAFFIILGTGLKIASLFMSKMFLFTAIIGGAAAIGFILWKKWDDIKPKLTAIWDALSDDSTTLSERLINVFKQVLGDWDVTLPGLVKVVERFWNSKLMPFLQNTVTPELRQIMGNMWNAIPDEWRERLKPMLKRLSQWSVDVLNLLLSVKQYISSTLESAWVVVQKAWQGDLGGIEDEVTHWWKDALSPFLRADVVGFIENTVSAAWDLIPEAWQNALAPIKARVEAFWKPIKSLLQNAVDFVGSTFALLWAGVKAVWMLDFNNLEHATKAWWQKLDSIIQDVVSLIGVTAKTAWDALPAVWQAKLNKLKGAVQDWWEKGVKPIIMPLKDAIGSALQFAWNLVAGVWTLDFRRIQKAAGVFLANLLNLLQHIPDFITNTLNVAWNALPSAWQSALQKLFETVKTWWDKDLWAKFDEIESFIQTTLSAWWDGVPDEWKAALDTFTSKVGEWWDDLKSWWGQNVTAFFQSWRDWFVGLFSDVKRSIKDVLGLGDEKVAQSTNQLSGPKIQSMPLKGTAPSESDIKATTKALKDLQDTYQTILTMSDSLGNVGTLQFKQYRNAMVEIGSAWSDTAQKIQSVQDSLGSNLDSKTKSMLDKVWATWYDFAVKLALHSLTTDVKKKVISDNEEMLTTVEQRTGKGLEGAFSKLKAAFSDLAQTFKGSFDEVLKEAGVNTTDVDAMMKKIDELTQQLTNSFGDLATAEEEKVKKATEAMNKKFKETSALHKLLGKDIDVSAENLQTLKQAINELVEGGVSPGNKELQALSERFKDLDMKLKAREGFRAIGQTVSDSISSMVDGVLRGTQTMEDAFKNMARNILISLASRAFTNAFNNLFNSFTNALFSSVASSGAGGGFLSSAASIIGGIFGSGKAGGGRVNPGTLYPVNERGMELFAPDVPGRVIPLGRGVVGGGGGGNVQVNIINNSGAQIDQQRRTSGGETIIDVTIGKVLNKDLRQGGTISQGFEKTYGLKRQGGSR